MERIGPAELPADQSNRLGEGFTDGGIVNARENTRVLEGRKLPGSRSRVLSSHFQGSPSPEFAVVWLPGL
jgi:hypothetical protein